MFFSYIFKACTDISSLILSLSLRPCLCHLKRCGKWTQFLAAQRWWRSAWNLGLPAWPAPPFWYQATAPLPRLWSGPGIPFLLLLMPRSHSNMTSLLKITVPSFKPRVSQTFPFKRWIVNSLGFEGHLVSPHTNFPTLPFGGKTSHGQHKNKQASHVLLPHSFIYRNG